MSEWVISGQTEVESLWKLQPQRRPDTAHGYRGRSQFHPAQKILGGEQISLRNHFQVRCHRTGRAVAILHALSLSYCGALHSWPRKIRHLFYYRMQPSTLHRSRGLGLWLSGCRKCSAFIDICLPLMWNWSCIMLARLPQQRDDSFSYQCWFLRHQKRNKVTFGFADDFSVLKNISWKQTEQMA